MSFFGSLDILGKSIKVGAVETCRLALRAMVNQYDITTEWIKLILSEATSCDNQEILTYFVSFVQSFIEKYNVDLQNLLVVCILEGNVRVTELLLRRGIKFSIEDMETHSLLEIFFKKKIPSRKDILMQLIQYEQLQSSYCADQNLFHRSIKLTENDSDAVEIAEVLINSGVSIEEVDEDGWTPLLYSVSAGQFSLVSFFIKKEANVNHVSSSTGDFPLMLAIRKRQYNLINLLLSNGADVNTRDEYGLTALHEACSKQNEIIVCCLLQKGAEISPEDNSGRTPLSLLLQNVEKDGCIIVSVREIAKLVFENLPYSINDMNLILNIRRASDYFENRTKELLQIASTKFYGIYSYYFVLIISNNIEKLAHFTKNKEFVKAFEANLHNFCYYAGDLQRIFQKAVQVRYKLEEVQSRLYLVFDNILPDIVIRKLADELAL